MKIDTHLHVWRKKEPPHLWMLDRAEGQHDVLMWNMEKSGVDKAVLVGSIREQNEDNNEYLSSITKKYPGQFQAWGTVKLREEGAFDTMVHCIDDLVLTGISFYMPTGQDFEFMLEDSMKKIWEGLVERGASFNTACASADSDVIDRLAERYPGLTIIIAHMGRPVVEESPPYLQWSKLLDLAKRPNVYIKLSGFYSFSEKGWGEIEYPYSEVYPFIKMLHDSFGAERLTWGSDFSPCLQFMTYQQALNVIEKRCDFLTNADKEWILCKTIQKIVKF